MIGMASVTIELCHAFDDAARSRCIEAVCVVLEQAFCMERAAFGCSLALLTEGEKAVRIAVRVFPGGSGKKRRETALALCRAAAETLGCSVAEVEAVIVTPGQERSGAG